MYLFKFFNKNNELMGYSRATNYTDALYRAGMHFSFTYTQTAITS